MKNTLRNVGRRPLAALRGSVQSSNLRRRRLSIEKLELRQLLAADLELFGPIHDVLFKAPVIGNLPRSTSLDDNYAINVSLQTSSSKELQVTVDLQNFDGVVAPALPASWTAPAATNAWITQATAPHTAPNRAFVANVGVTNDSSLVSNTFALTAANRRLTFQNNYNVEDTWDGGVLELSIAGGAFVDIVSAGGNFLTGGYSGLLNAGSPNPLTGRQAWTGTSGGYILTTVDLPVSAIGQNVQLRWRLGSDESVSSVGWAIDTIQLSDPPPPPPNDFGDAPLPYPVLTSENGARHTLGALFLGTLADTETDGVHSAAADGDGADEDGVTLGTMTPGSSATATVRASTTGGILNAWIDFNDDGDWSDSGEQIFTNTVLASGVNSLNFNVPATAINGTITYGRFRVSTQSNLAVTGLATDGEVEDYQVTIGTPRLRWTNRGQASDRFDATFGANAALARGVVDAVITSWDRVLANLNGSGQNTVQTINITISMSATGTGFGASAGGSFNAQGFPSGGNVTVGRGNDTNADGLGDGAGFFLDPTPLDYSEFLDSPTGGAFLGRAPVGSPARNLSDLFTLVNAEITHSVGLFSAPGRLNNNPLSGTVSTTGITDNSEGGGVGTYRVFDGPSVTHLMTSNNGGGGGSDFNSAIHTAGPNTGAATNQPVVFNSAFRGARSLVGADDPGNAIYSFSQRTLVNDVLALIFQDAYGYTINLPQTFGTVYASLNGTTGVLQIQGGVGTSADVISLETIGSKLRVSVNIGNDVGGTGPNGDTSDIAAFVSDFELATVTSINILSGDGNDQLNIRPLIGKAITINGGNPAFPNGGVGDNLTLNLAGVSGGVLTNNNNGTGSFTSSTHGAVTWSSIEVLANATATSIDGRRLFYNNSLFDGNSVAANTNDDAAIASDKQALLPGILASFVNYSSYSRGINGIMLDVKGLANTPTAADFVFQVGNTATPPVFSAAPSPLEITRRIGLGTNGSDRITITWADNAIRNRWLRVQLLATPVTGTNTSDVFYFGNQVGETGNQAGNTAVNAADSAGVVNNPSGFTLASITNVYDFNRDRAVNATDSGIVVNNPSGFSSLVLFTPPLSVVLASGSSAQGSSAAPLLKTVSVTPQQVSANATGFGLAPEGSPYDLNNDRKINALDVAIALNNQATAAAELAASAATKEPEGLVSILKGAPGQFSFAPRGSRNANTLRASTDVVDLAFTTGPFWNS